MHVKGFFVLSSLSTLLNAVAVIIFTVNFFEDFLIKVLTLFYDSRDKFWIRRKYSVSMHEAI